MLICFFQRSSITSYSQVRGSHKIPEEHDPQQQLRG